MTAARRTLFLTEMGLGPQWAWRNRERGLSAPEEGAQEPAVREPSASSEAPLLPAMATAAPDAITLPPLPKDTLNLSLDLTAEQEWPSVQRMDWAELEQTVSGCTRCGLCQSRTRTVFGKGNQRAKWLFVGEGPGRQEDLQGVPFIGPAGKLLDNMLRAMGLDVAQDVFIANVVKCRPTDPGGRDRPPTPAEAQACLPYLQRQIDLLAPTVIVALGKSAALTLLDLPPDTPVGRLRGVVHRYRDIPLIVTYHPAYLLRQLGEKGKVWRDLCLALSSDVPVSS